MRRFVIAFAALCVALGVGVESLQAHELNVSAHSSYIDTDTFVERFSNDPVLKIEPLLDLGNGFYVAPYAYTGFKNPLNDKSSEYGLEVGWEGEIGKNTLLDLAAGRFANYAGGGFNEGDWFVRAGVTRGDLYVAISYLKNISNTLIIHAEYDLHPTERLTITPVLSYLTAGKAMNPGVVANYRLTDNVSLTATCIVPNRDGGRHAYVSVGIALKF